MHSSSLPTKLSHKTDARARHREVETASPTVLATFLGPPIRGWADARTVRARGSGGARLEVRSVSQALLAFGAALPSEGQRGGQHGYRNTGSGCVSVRSRTRAAMSQVCCPSCELRFTSAASAFCPECGRPTHSTVCAEDVLGFRLFTPEDMPHELPEAVAVSIPVPDPSWQSAMTDLPLRDPGRRRSPDSGAHAPERSPSSASETIDFHI